jgi:hypothetical protein
MACGTVTRLSSLTMVQPFIAVRKNRGLSLTILGALHGVKFGGRLWAWAGSCLWDLPASTISPSSSTSLLNDVFNSFQSEYSAFRARWSPTEEADHEMHGHLHANAGLFAYIHSLLLI